MKVTVLYFQALREAAGTESETLELGDEATAGDALEAAIVRHGALEEHRQSIFIAVNEEWTAADQRLNNGDTVALMPPVSGG